MIKKDDFNAYVSVQESGVTNMFDLKAVMSLTGLTKKQCLEIMRNYSEYKAIFKKED